MIDLTPVLDRRAEGDRGPAAVAPIVDQLDAACRDVGFFTLVGHGLDRELDAAFAAARSFFGASQADKERVPRANRFGYVPLRELAIDRQRLGGLTEYLDIGFGDDMGVGAAEATLADPWPVIAGFRSAVQRYQRGAAEVAALLLEAIALALGLPLSFFAERMERPPSKLRLLHYLPTALDGAGTRPITNEAHTDYGVITLLATDGVPGLELRPRGGDWAPVSAPDGGLVVNLGDLLAVWTNLRYTSTLHRVVSSPDRDRYSIPLFVNVDDETLVECLPGCVSHDDPARLAPVTAGAYLAGRIDKTIPEPYAT